MTRERRKPKNPKQQFKKKRRKPCVFCVDKKSIDYKDVSFIRRFMTDRGKIAPRRMTGCCTLHQRLVTRVIKQARQMGLVPFMVD